VYFHGSWKSPFDERLTRNAPFTTLDGRELGVALMYRTIVAPAVLTPEYDAVELPYLGERIAFLAIVPADFAAFESTLDAAKLAEIRASLEDLRMRVFLPRFSIRTRTELREPLRALEVIDAFTPLADFSAIEPTRSLVLSGAIHEATIDVTEVGTVAAAATGSVFEPISLPPEVRFERPFVFAIVDRPTGAVLFLGRFVEPQ
jgi:serpin B